MGCRARRRRSAWAVGEFTPAGGVNQPLVFTYDGHSWTQQAMPLGGPFTASLSGVSCTSATFCMLVGAFENNTGEFRWNGSSFTQQSILGVGPAQFTSVSCLSSSFCESAGWTSVASSHLVEPFAAIYNGNTWNGPGVPIPDNGKATNSLFYGVSCVSTTDCQGVGNFFATGSGGVFGASYNGNSWSSQPTPPVTNAGLGAVACATASFCWALGAYQTSTGLTQTLGDVWTGAGWDFALLPNPNGTNPGLNGASCLSPAFCEAVGSYEVNGVLTPYAEQYAFLIGPRLITPHRFALKVHRTRKQGGTVIAVLKKPKTLGLLVQIVKHGHANVVGVVPLGHHPAGTSRIHWNLRVNGKPLGKGTYNVSLSSEAGGILSPPTPPGEVTLIVNPNGHLHIQK